VLPDSAEQTLVLGKSENLPRVGNCLLLEVVQGQVIKFYILYHLDANNACAPQYVGMVAPGRRSLEPLLVCTKRSIGQDIPVNGEIDLFVREYLAPFAQRSLSRAPGAAAAAAPSAEGTWSGPASLVNVSERG
jgi:hypothetical protein